MSYLFRALITCSPASSTIKDFLLEPKTQFVLPSRNYTLVMVLYLSNKE